MPDPWYLTGATASGKTAAGIELARLLNAEIISLDSMAVYRGMDIGTAKPTADQRRAVPHHLVDLVEPHQDYSLAQYLAAAGAKIGEIRSRAREVLFVGGTPLYLKAMLRGIFTGPPADWKLRTRLEELASAEGPDALHRKLAEVDPVAAARLEPGDTRRLIRALEVFEKTGKSITSLQQQFDRARPAEQCRVFVLDWPREELHVRIDQRVDAMFSAGLVDEVRGLTSAGRTLSRSASQAVGYREVLDHLAGRLSLDECVALVKTRTRQFSKRQRTWYRSLSECRMVPLTGTIDPQEVARKIVAAARPSTD